MQQVKTKKVSFNPQAALNLNEHDLELARRMLEKEDAIIARNTRRESLLKNLAG